MESGEREVVIETRLCPWHQHHLIQGSWDPDRVIAIDTSFIGIPGWIRVSLPGPGFYTWSDKPIRLPHQRQATLSVHTLVWLDRSIAKTEVNREIVHCSSYDGKGSMWHADHRFYWDGKSEIISKRGGSVAHWAWDGCGNKYPRQWTIPYQLKFAKLMAPFAAKAWRPMEHDLPWDKAYVEEWINKQIVQETVLFIDRHPNMRKSNSWSFLKASVGVYIESREDVDDTKEMQLRDIRELQVNQQIPSGIVGCGFEFRLYRATKTFRLSMNPRLLEDTKVKCGTFEKAKDPIMAIFPSDFTDAALKILLLRRVVRRYQNVIIERLWRPGGLMCERGFREISELTQQRQSPNPLTT